MVTPPVDQCVTCHIPSMLLHATTFAVADRPAACVRSHHRPRDRRSAECRPILMSFGLLAIGPTRHTALVRARSRRCTWHWAATKPAAQVRNGVFTVEGTAPCRYAEPASNCSLIFSLGDSVFRSDPPLSLTASLSPYAAWARALRESAAALYLFEAHARHAGMAESYGRSASSSSVHASSGY